MSYNLRTNAKGRQGRRSNTTDVDDSDGGKLVEDSEASNPTDSGGIGAVSSSSSSPRILRGGYRKSEVAITTTRKAHVRAESELEARIEQIRRRYRQQECILEEEITRLEQTYRFALAELDKVAEQGWSQAHLDHGDRCSADENLEWETTSEYPPTEPRGMSRSPSPVFAY
jgi:hypothetical protein